MAPSGARTGDVSARPLFEVCRQFGLPSHVGFAMIEGMAVFLDVTADRYCALAGAPTDWDMATLEELEHSGLVVEAPDARSLQPTRVRPPELDLAGPHRARVHVSVVAEIWIDLAQIRQGLRAGRFHSLVRSDSIDHLSAPKDLEKLVARYHVARRYVPIAPNCLQDSLGLRRYLARRSIACSIIFAVKTSPFSAHCWLQHEDVLLNEALDVADQFVPVLAAP